MDVVILHDMRSYMNHRQSAVHALTVKLGSSEKDISAARLE